MQDGGDESTIRVGVLSCEGEGFVKVVEDFVVAVLDEGSSNHGDVLPLVSLINMCVAEMPIFHQLDEAHLLTT
jgi:hypothetical protein